MDKITEYIKTRRKSMGMSQEALADRVNLSLSTVKRREIEGWQSGELIEVCRAIDVEIMFIPKEGRIT